MSDKDTYYLENNLENEWTEELELTMQELKEGWDLPTEEVQKTLEKRKAKRIELRVPILVGNGNRITESLTVDMNYNGCFIETQAPYQVGDKIKLSLETKLHGIGGLLQGTISSDTIDAIVRWRRVKAETPDEYVGMGVEFINLNQVQKKSIRDILLISETETLMSYND